MLALPKVEAPGHPGHPPLFSDAVVNGCFLDHEQVLRTKNSLKQLGENFKRLSSYEQ